MPAAADSTIPVQTGKIKKPRTEKQIEAFKKCLQTRLNKIDERKKLAAAQVQAAQELTKAAVEGTLNEEVTAKIMRPFQQAVLAQPSAVEKAASRRVKKLVEQQRQQSAAASLTDQQEPEMEVDDAQQDLALAIEAKQRELHTMMQSMRDPSAIQRPRPQRPQSPPLPQSSSSEEALPFQPPPPTQQPPARQRMRSSRNPDAAMQRAMARMPRASLPKRPREPVDEDEYAEEYDEDMAQPQFEASNYGPSIQQLHPSYLAQLQASMVPRGPAYEQGHKKKSVTTSEYQQRLFAASLGF